MFATNQTSILCLNAKFVNNIGAEIVVAKIMERISEVQIPWMNNVMVSLEWAGFDLEEHYFKVIPYIYHPNVSLHSWISGISLDQVKKESDISLDFQ